MRRFLSLAVWMVVLLSSVLAVPASAESSATKIDVSCTVTREGDCLVTTNVLLRLDSAYERLSFPLPPQAKGVSLNGSSVTLTKTDAGAQVDISRLVRDYQGDLSLRFEYTLPNVVKFNPDLTAIYPKETVLELIIPMLSGFSMPVDSMSFVVNLPDGKITSRPNFISTYRQTSFNSDVDLLPMSGNQIIGTSKVRLNDYDGVTMKLVMPAEMFPTVSTYIRTGNPEIIPMLIFAGAALVYWLLFLRTRPFFPIPMSNAPESITAGELGCRLTLAGGDLTAMVFSWAQMGYLLISLDGNHRVLLHKRMDMGNERNAFENKVFRELFGSRRVVDATGVAYARLYRRVAAMVPNERNLHKAGTGSKKIYRLLCCGSMVFLGRCIAMNMTTSPFLQMLLSIILAVVGVITGWLILGMAPRTHLRGKMPVLYGFLSMLLWILLGILCGQPWIPLVTVLAMLLLGYPAAYGGRRSELGRHDAGQVLGLRRHLKKISNQDINRLLANDPDYFFHLAPSALALGVMTPFAKRFGQRKFQQCPYIVTQVTGKRTADEWGLLIVTIADMMDVKQKRMVWEQWLSLPAVEVVRRPKKAQPQKAQPQKSTQKKKPTR